MALMALINVLLFCCAISSGPAEPQKTTAGVSHGSSSVQRKLVAAKVALMSADYRADLAQLASLRNEVAPLREDPALGYLADYWSGYASWRIAINGANASMPSQELKAHLERATADFESSIRKKDDFADGYAAASSVDGWLMMFHRDDPTVLKSLMETSMRFLKRAEELEPSNPRVLWVRGGYFLFAPAAHGGNPERAIEIYRRQVESSPPLEPHSPLPDWGKPEALMSLAYAHLNQAPPDLNAAAEEARAALRLQPQWHYVRDILMSQINERSKQSEGAKH